MYKIKSEQLAFPFLQTLTISVCWDPVDGLPYSKTLLYLVFLSFFLSSSSAHWWAVLLNEMSNCFSLGSKMLFAIPPCAFRGLLHPNFILGPLDLSMFPFLEWDLTLNLSELCPHTLLDEDPL